jgi:hypothetical protein
VCPFSLIHIVRVQRQNPEYRYIAKQDDADVEKDHKSAALTHKKPKTKHDSAEKQTMKGANVTPPSSLELINQQIKKFEDYVLCETPKLEIPGPDDSATQMDVEILLKLVRE